MIPASKIVECRSETAKTTSEPEMECIATYSNKILFTNKKPESDFTLTKLLTITKIVAVLKQVLGDACSDIDKQFKETLSFSI